MRNGPSKDKQDRTKMVNSAVSYALKVYITQSTLDYNAIKENAEELRFEPEAYYDLCCKAFQNISQEHSERLNYALLTSSSNGYPLYPRPIRVFPGTINSAQPPRKMDVQESLFHSKDTSFNVIYKRKRAQYEASDSQLQNATQPPMKLIALVDENQPTTPVKKDPIKLCARTYHKTASKSFRAKNNNYNAPIEYSNEEFIKNLENIKQSIRTRALVRAFKKLPLDDNYKAKQMKSYVRKYRDLHASELIALYEQTYDKALSITTQINYKEFFQNNYGVSIVNNAKARAYKLLEIDDNFQSAMLEKYLGIHGQENGKAYWSFYKAVHKKTIDSFSPEMRAKVAAKYRGSLLAVKGFSLSPEYIEQYVHDFPGYEDLFRSTLKTAYEDSLARQLKKNSYFSNNTQSSDGADLIIIKRAKDNGSRASIKPLNEVVVRENAEKNYGERATLYCTIFKQYYISAKAKREEKSNKATISQDATPTESINPRKG